MPLQSPRMAVQRLREDRGTMPHHFSHIHLFYVTRYHSTNTLGDAVSSVRYLNMSVDDDDLWYPSR